MKTKYLLLLLLFLSSTLQAQEPELIRWSQVRSGGTEDRLIKKGDRFFLSKPSVTYPEINDQISDIIIDSFYVSDEIYGDFVFPKSSLMLEYKVGEGFVDYDLVNYTSRMSGFDVEGQYKAFTFGTLVKSINSNLFYTVEIDTLSNEYYKTKGYFSVAVLDSETDSLMYLESLYGSATGFEDVILQGDYLYVIVHGDNTYDFMGVPQHDYFEHTEGGFVNEKVLHKINWRTKEIIWTRNFWGKSKIDPVYDFRLIQDSLLILALETNGFRYWEGERIDVPADPDLGYDMAFYKINTEGDLLDYKDIDTWANGFYGANIEDDGSILVHGGQLNTNPLNPIVFDEDTMYVSSDSLVAILGYMSADWEDIWMKSYPGSLSSGVFGANYSVEDDEIVVPINFLENIVVEGSHFIASHAGEAQNPIAGLADNAFVLYDSNGQSKYTPAVLPVDLWIYEAHKIAEKHYLFYAFDRKGDNPMVFGAQLGNANYDNSRFIFEIKGEWLDIINNLDNLISEIYEHVDVYPNPAMSGQEVNIPVVSTYDKLSIDIISMSGKITPIYNYTNNKDEINIRLPELDSGIYTIRINTKEKIYNSKIVIQ